MYELAGRSCEDIWNKAAELLKASLGPITLLSSRLQYDEEQDRYILLVNNEIAKGKIGEALDEIKERLSQVLEHEIRLVVRLDKKANKQVEAGQQRLDFPSPEEPIDHTGAQQSKGGLIGFPVNSYTFEGFIEGDRNRFAKVVATRFAGGVDKGSSCLYFCGKPGLGKTHLLCALGHYIHEVYPSLVVTYTTYGKFVGDFVNATRNGKTGGFDSFDKVTDVDVFVLDDIGDVDRKGGNGSREQLFSTIQLVLDNGGNVVCAGTLFPKDIVSLPEGLLSRLEKGPIVSLRAPDSEIMMAILHKLNQEEGANIPECVLKQITETVNQNARTLQGAYHAVAAYISLGGEQLKPDNVAEILTPYSASGSGLVTPEQILELVSKRFGVDGEAILGKSRSAGIVWSRHVAMYLVGELTGMLSVDIGRFFNRDQSTVRHACGKIKNLMSPDEDMAENVAKRLIINELRAELRGE